MLKEPKAAANRFFSCAPSDANDSELLFFSLLLLQHAERARELQKLHDWAACCVRDAAAVAEASPSQVWEPKVEHFLRLQQVYEGTWAGADLDVIGAAMQRWEGPCGPGCIGRIVPSATLDVPSI